MASKEEALEEITNQLAESYLWLVGGKDSDLTEEESEEYEMDCMDMAALFLEASKAEIISADNGEIVLKIKRIDMYDYFDSNIQR